MPLIQNQKLFYLGKFSQFFILLKVWRPWAGARERPVQKYADMYSKLGYTSVQLGLNLEPMSLMNEMLMNQSFWTPSEQEYYRSEMKKHVDEISSELDRKLILHMFSNGGTQVYMSLKFGIFMLSLVFDKSSKEIPIKRIYCPNPLLIYSTRPLVHPV